MMDIQNAFAPASEAETHARVARKIDIVVIGAGQAGLSSAYHLSRFGLSPQMQYVVVDRSPQPGGAWQFRWPSLTLSTVNGIHDLPGMKFADAVDTSMGEVHASVAVPQYYGAYEKAFDLPVHRPVAVKVVCERGERFRVETDAGVYAARGIINATGTWESPLHSTLSGIGSLQGASAAHQGLPDRRAVCRAARAGRRRRHLRDPAAR